MEANPEICPENTEKSLALAAALVPAIGYDRAAEIAKEAFRTGKTIREMARNVLPEQQLEKLLDLSRMTAPE